MTKNLVRRLLFGVLFVLAVYSGRVFAYCLWVAGGPPEPPDVRAYYTKWANIFGILFLSAGWELWSFLFATFAGACCIRAGDLPHWLRTEILVV
jgi:hypothetical protein